MIFKPKFSHLFFLSLGLYMIGGELFGILYGLSISNMTYGALFGLYWGIACGVAFPIVMQLISFLLEIKYRKLRKAIAADRRLICDGSATLNGNGGWLYFTEQGLEFYPHKINLSTDKVILPLHLIESVETTKNILIVKLAADLSYPFVVAQNNDWKRCLDGYRAEAAPKKASPHTESPSPESETGTPYPAADTDAPYVFISYSSNDQQEAEAMRTLLSVHGIATWMAPYDIPAGSKYAYVINDAIEGCACVLLMLSESSQASQFVEREVERAISYNKTVVSMHLDDSILNSGFKFYLGQAQIIPVRSIDESNPSVQKVVRSLAHLVSLA